MLLNFTTSPRADRVTIQALPASHNILAVLKMCIVAQPSARPSPSTSWKMIFPSSSSMPKVWFDVGSNNRQILAGLAFKRALCMSSTSSEHGQRCAYYRWRQCFVTPDLAVHNGANVSGRHGLAHVPQHMAEGASFSVR